MYIYIYTYLYVYTYIYIYVSLYIRLYKHQSLRSVIRANLGNPLWASSHGATAHPTVPVRAAPAREEFCGSTTAVCPSAEYRLATRRCFTNEHDKRNRNTELGTD